MSLNHNRTRFQVEIRMKVMFIITCTVQIILGFDRGFVGYLSAERERGDLAPGPVGCCASSRIHHDRDET